MRLWSLHPRLLDAKGLVAVWREALLAKKVLQGRTRGYRNHPQLARFRNVKNPLGAINQYLAAVFDEAERRNYAFDKSKIDWGFRKSAIRTTTGQLQFELQHLRKKLKVRDREKWGELVKVGRIEAHPLFRTVKGRVESWEIAFAKKRSVQRPRTRP